LFEYIFQVTSDLAGVRPRDGRPPLPAAAAVGQTRDSTTGANEDEPEISEAAKILLKQQVQSLSAKVEEVLPFRCLLSSTCKTNCDTICCCCSKEKFILHSGSTFISASDWMGA